jgi:hypothetical protein
VVGKSAASSSSGEPRDVVRESSDVVGRSTGRTVDYRLDVTYDYTYEGRWSLQSLMTGTAEAVYAAVNDSHVLIMSSNSVPAMNFDKEHAKCIVHRIPNDFGIVDSA